jgi:hypothetical protein
LLTTDRDEPWNEVVEKGELLVIAFALCAGATSIKRANSFILGNGRQLHGCPACTGVTIMLQQTPLEMIDLQRRLNRMAELQGKVVLSAHELREYQVLRLQFREYVADLARESASSRKRC